MKIVVFYNIEPCLEVHFEERQNCNFGVHRDRHPDSGWGEFRSTRMDKEYCKEVELTPKLKKILIEDICTYYNGEQAYKKLVELDLIK